MWTLAISSWLDPNDLSCLLGLYSVSISAMYLGPDTEQLVPRSTQSQRTSSPEFWSPPPASHSSNQHQALLSTRTSSLQCPVSFRHHWTHFLLPSIILAFECCFESCLRVCCPCPQSSSSPVHPPYPIQDSPQWFYPWSPGTVGQHRSEFLITSRSLRLLTCFLLSLIDSQ